MHRPAITAVAMIAALAAMLVMYTTPASATTAGWMLKGTLLSAEGLTTAAVATETIVDEPFEVAGGGANTRCEGVLGIGGEIKSVTKTSDGILIFSKCTTTTPSCSVPNSVA